MADQKISDLAASTAPAADDLTVSVDVSDATMAATGTNKTLTLAALLRTPVPPTAATPTVGAIALDAATSAAYELRLTGDATVTLAGGRAGAAVTLEVDRNGHALTFGGAGADAIAWRGGVPLFGPGMTRLALVWSTLLGKWLGDSSSAGLPVVLSSVSGAVTLDATSAAAYEISLTGDATVTLAGGASPVQLLLIADRNGHALTFGGAGADAIAWLSGSDPAGDFDDPAVYDFRWSAAAGSWLGYAPGGTADYVTAESLATTLEDYATASALSAHASDASNPHGVTKAQVGLGSVDDTSDASKPISTLTQAALDGKQASLPTGQSSSKFLGGDFAFHDLPARKDLVCLGQWTSSSSSPLTAGDMADQYSLFPADFDVLYVSVIAKSNGAGGGFTFNLSVNGTNLFSSAQSYAASTTTLAVISSGFATASFTGGAAILATIATAGSDVLSVTIALHGRSA